MVERADVQTCSFLLVVYHLVQISSARKDCKPFGDFLIRSASLIGMSRISSYRHQDDHHECIIQSYRRNRNIILDNNIQLNHIPD